MSNRGALGSFIGGMTSPFIGLLTITLLFVTFKKQSDSTRIQYMALKDERSRRRQDDCSKLIDDGIRRLDSIIDQACYVRRDEGGVKNPYRGIDGIYRFCVDCSAANGSPYSENEVLADILQHWLFEGGILLRHVSQFAPDQISELMDRLKIQYSFAVAKSLNTLLKAPVRKGEYGDALERIRVAKEDFEAALEGHFDGVPLV